MKKILQYLQEHIRSEYHPGYYITVGLMLTGMIVGNYMLNFETDWVIRPYFRTEWGLLAYMLFYGVPYMLTILAYAFFHDEWKIFRDRDFWIRTSVIILILGFDGGFYYYDWAVQNLGLTNAYEHYWIRRCAGTLGSAFAIGIPLLIFWYIYDKQQQSFYGLGFKGFDWKPYATILGLMAIIVFAASFMEQFRSYYPTLKFHYVEQIPNWNPSTCYAIYEPLYGLDFMWTELMFRGFMVIGMAGILGKGAVLPMTVVYASRHFAKPWAETVSSIFGGYILGVIALHSRNVMGGVFIHAGIALMMDGFALLQIFVLS